MRLKFEAWMAALGMAVITGCMSLSEKVASKDPAVRTEGITRAKEIVLDQEESEKDRLAALALLTEDARLHEILRQFCLDKKLFDYDSDLDSSWGGNSSARIWANFAVVKDILSRIKNMSPDDEREVLKKVAPHHYKPLDPWIAGIVDKMFQSNDIDNIKTLVSERRNLHFSDARTEKLYEKYLALEKDTSSLRKLVDNPKEINVPSNQVEKVFEKYLALEKNADSLHGLIGNPQEVNVPSNQVGKVLEKYLALEKNSANLKKLLTDPNGSGIASNQFEKILDSYLTMVPSKTAALRELLSTPVKAPVVEESDGTGINTNGRRKHSHRKNRQSDSSEDQPVPSSAENPFKGLIQDRLLAVNAEAFAKGNIAAVRDILNSGDYSPLYIQEAFKSKNEDIALEICKKFPWDVPSLASFIEQGMEKCADYLLANGRKMDGSVCIFLDAYKQCSEDHSSLTNFIESVMKGESDKYHDIGKGWIDRLLSEQSEKYSKYCGLFARRDVEAYYNDRVGLKPLQRIAVCGRLDFLKKHIDKIKNLDEKFYGWTAIELALHNGHTEMADYLLEQGAKNPFVTQIFAFKVSMTAEKAVKTAAWLVSHKLSTLVAIYDQAIATGSIDFAKALKAKTPQLKPTRKFHEYFTREKDEDLIGKAEDALAIAKYLKECGVAIEDGNYSALGQFLYRAWQMDKKRRGWDQFKTLLVLAKYCIDEGSNVNVDVGRYYSRISDASDLEMHQLASRYSLLPSAIESEAKGWGMKPADIAKLINDLAGITKSENYQIRCGFADFNNQNNGLGIGANMKDHENIRDGIAYWMIRNAWEALGKIEYTNSRKASALYAAVDFNDIDLCELLIKKGAKLPAIQEESGKVTNAIDLAEENGNQKLVRLLRVAERKNSK